MGGGDMAADASIFQQFLQPVRSVQDYANDMDKRDLNALQLVAMRRQNDLADLTAQQTRDQLAQNAAKRNALQALYADPSMSDPIAREQAQLANPLLAADGQAAQTARLTAEHLKAQAANQNALAGKNAAEQQAAEYKARIDKANQALKDIASFQHPGEALADLQAKMQAGHIQPEQAQVIAQQLQSIQNPAQWQQWQQQTRYRILDAKDQLEQDWKAKAEGRATTNDAAQNANRELIPDPNNPGRFIVNQPLVDAKARIAAAGAAQVPGMTYMTDQAGNIVGLPTKAPLGKPVVANVVRDASGTPLPSKDGGMTEDQGKASGWLVQASNAFKNMTDAISTDKQSMKPGLADAVADVPGLGAIGNAFRSEGRQKFMQASSSMSEALLRAATGAGVNAEEARQKIQELTPVWGEKPGTTQQKMDAIPLYIESLKARAGKGGNKAASQALDAAGVVAPTAAPKIGARPSAAPASAPKVVDFSSLK